MAIDLPTSHHLPSRSTPAATTTGSMSIEHPTPSNINIAHLPQMVFLPPNTLPSDPHGYSNLFASSIPLESINLSPFAYHLHNHTTSSNDSCLLHLALVDSSLVNPVSAHLDDNLPLLSLYCTYWLINMLCAAADLTTWCNQLTMSAGDWAGWGLRVDEEGSDNWVHWDHQWQSHITRGIPKWTWLEFLGQCIGLYISYRSIHRQSYATSGDQWPMRSWVKGKQQWMAKKELIRVQSGNER